MQPGKFAELNKELLDGATEIMAAKQREYSTPGNVLENFDQLARELGKPPEAVAYEYLFKHIQSVGSLVRGLSAGGNFHQLRDNLTERPEGRLQDIINYCLFLNAMYYRRDKGMVE